MQFMKKWKFFTYEEEEPQSNPSGDKHFNSLTGNQSLIRELIQNSLDAISQHGEPVTVKISFKNLEYSKYKKYFEELKPHYEASYENHKFPSRGEIRFLILEDFNTLGLEGKKEEFFFSRHNMRSDENIQSGGSHGIGKIVFYVSSQIGTIFAFSISNKKGDGKRRVFKGRVALKTHKIDNIDYRPHGVLKLDIEEDKQFLEDLFTRNYNEKGLSIAIPFIEEDIRHEDLKEAVINEYYYPIIKKKLVVCIDGEEINDDFILKQEKPKTELVSEFVTDSEAIKVYLKDSYKEKEPKISEKEKITSLFKEKGFVFIKFYLDITLKKEKKGGYFYLLIKKKAEEEDEKFDFWRKNLLITEAGRKKSSSEYTVIVLVDGDEDDNELAVLLRKLEGPNHTKWEYQSSNKDIKDIKLKYGRYISKLVIFITQLPNKIISLFKNQDIELDENFFSDFFPIANIKGSKNRNVNSSQGIDIPPIPPSNSNFVFRENRKNDGFILSLSESGKKEKISEVTITVAYGTNKGNPFKNYDSRDFDLKNIDVRLDKGKLLQRDKNIIKCQINDKDFKISLYGFDLNDRELILKIKES